MCCINTPSKWFWNRSQHDLGVSQNWGYRRPHLPKTVWSPKRFSPTWDRILSWRLRPRQWGRFHHSRRCECHVLRRRRVHPCTAPQYRPCPRLVCQLFGSPLRSAHPKHSWPKNYHCHWSCRELAQSFQLHHSDTPHPSLHHQHHLSWANTSVSKTSWKFSTRKLAWKCFLVETDTSKALLMASRSHVTQHIEGVVGEETLVVQGCREHLRNRSHRCLTPMLVFIHDLRAKSRNWLWSVTWKMSWNVLPFIKSISFKNIIQQQQSYCQHDFLGSDWWFSCHRSKRHCCTHLTLSLRPYVPSSACAG